MSLKLFTLGFEFVLFEKSELRSDEQKLANKKTDDYLNFVVVPQEEQRRDAASASAKCTWSWIHGYGCLEHGH